MATKYTTTGTLQAKRVMHPAGSIVEIADAAEAKRLIARGAIVPMSGRHAAAPSDLDAAAPVRTLVPQIKESSDAIALSALRAAELNRPEGARSSVITAIDERLEGIDRDPSTDADDEDDEG